MSQVIADRFELERLIGTGGMGEVFRAKDRLTGGAVAVKVLYASMSRDLDRFKREAQILAEVSHPRIVKYVAHGIASGRPYLAMEWLDGEDLGEILGKQGMSLRDSIVVVRRVAEALSALHERGIVHRDIKPSNIFLVGNKADQSKLLDFGVARLLHASRQSTRSGVMVGTPGYMAPEQARGAKEIDARADVFALGCVLFECLAGRPAFAADNIAALLAKILLESPPSLRESDIDVPIALDDLVTRMLSKHPVSRPANGSAVLRELDAFVDLKDGPVLRASVPHQRALTGSERRLVSVVMASYSDSPDIDEPVPPSAMATAAASFDPRAIVASFGAEAEQLADGSIVVTLMGKGGASDQAAHAARCALALRSHMLNAQVALATGLATVTDRSPVGEVIERAAAILTSAKLRAGGSSGDETLHGQSPVFLDETTAGLLDMRFDVGGDDRGLFIRGLRERETKPRTLLGKITPFVGRDRELGTVLGLFEESVNEPVARAVLVTGPAGAGKSRMTTEIIKRIGDETSAEVWLARGDPMSEGSPFSLLARLVRRAAGISGGESLVVRQQKLRARVGRHVKEPDLSRITEFVGEMASVPFPDAHSVQLRAARQDSILMGDQMRRAFSDLVLAETRSGPLVVVLEDLHWGDLPSVNMLDAALRAAAERPFMVLAVARSEVHDQFPSLWEQRSVQEIRVGPLVRRAGEKLIREVLGTKVSQEEVNRLLDRAAGNVFYLEELIRAYADGRGLSSRPATMPPTPTTGTAAGDDAAWALPGTVLAMVEARLERLDPMARRVLRAASIFGEVFWRGGLLALTGGEYKATEVDEWLSELSRREIVQRRDMSRFPADQELVFRHALVRDAAYQMLTAEDRALGHKLAGEWLERAGEHEAMVLAEHFERGGARDKAITSYLRAASQALEGNDFDAAKQRAERAIQAGASGEQLGRLSLLLAESARWTGQYDVAATNARSALNNLPVGSDEWFHAAAESVESAMTVGHLDDARTAVNAAVEQFGSGTMTTARVISMCRIAVRLVVAGAFETADGLMNRIESEAAEILKKEPAARAFFYAARVARAKWLGDTEDAAIFAQEAVSGFEQVGDARNAAVQRDNAGYALICLGAFTAGEAMLRDAVDMADTLGLPAVANEARLHLGQLLGRLQKKDEAIAVIQEVIGGFAAQRDRIGEGRARGYLAGVHQIAQDHESAEREAKLALPLFTDTAPYRASLLALIAMTRVDRGEAKAAIEAALEAKKLLDSLGGALEIQAVIGLAYAESLRACGDIEGSKKAIAAARSRLLERASRIKNPEWRRGFTERLQEHMRILMRAGEWLA